MPFISPPNPLWLQTLTHANNDIYHLPGYCQLEAEVLEGKPIAWTTDIEGVNFLIPLIERVIHSNGTSEKDLVSPYGYPGILYPENTPQQVFTEAIKRFQSEAAAQGYVSSFIRMHPIYNAFQVNELSSITQHHHGSTVSINLSLPLSVIRKAYSQNHKRHINRLLNKKLEQNEYS